MAGENKGKHQMKGLPSRGRTPWRELEAAGIKRCCAMFTTGKRCRRRAIADSSWCEKHDATMQAHIERADRGEK